MFLQIVKYQVTFYAMFQTKSHMLCEVCTDMVDLISFLCAQIFSFKQECLSALCRATFIVGILV